jgi:hypothetical protein
MTASQEIVRYIQIRLTVDEERELDLDPILSASEWETSGSSSDWRILTLLSYSSAPWSEASPVCPLAESRVEERRVG